MDLAYLKLLMISTILGVCISFSAYGERITAATADWSPYAMQTEDGELNGIAVDILREVATMSGHEIAISLMPAKRLNLQFDKNKLDMNFADSPAWNPSQEQANYIFTDSYTSVVENIYFLDQNFQQVSVPDQLSDKTLGITRGYYYELFEQAFSQRIVRKYEAPTNRHLILMLEKNRIDAAFFDDVLFNHLLRQEGFDSSRFRKGMQLSDAPIGFKLRKEKQHLVPDLNSAISYLKKEGRISEIIAKYTQ